MEFETINITDLKPAGYNPRKISDAEYSKLEKSINEFGLVDPIIVNLKNNRIIGGHQRYDVLFNEFMEDTTLNEELKLLRFGDIGWVFNSTDFTVKSEDHEKALNLALNKISGEWDESKLVPLLEDLQLKHFDVELTGFDELELTNLNTGDDTAGSKYDIDGSEKGNLSQRFIVPPFSVLDTKNGEWQTRKREWLEITGNLSETRNTEFGKVSGSDDGDSLFSSINEGTSNFDPVLVEIIYTWFGRENTKILDPFGGEQTKGVVAGELGLEYHAVEIRPEQVDLNKDKTAGYMAVNYYDGDSNNIDEIITDTGFNLCFTSPPYYDLEVYSKEDMSALGTYEEFMEQYKNIFSKVYNMLEPNSFLVLKVGEIRDKKTGQYRCFVADNVKIMEEIGFRFYNDIVLLNSIGTAPIRANNSMKNRKIVKVHQNILVFYKGELNSIKDYYPVIEDEDDE